MKVKRSGRAASAGGGHAEIQPVLEPVTGDNQRALAALLLRRQGCV